MTEAAAAGVQLDVQRVGAQVALQFDEVIAAAQRAELGHAALGASLTAPGWLPRVIDGEPVALGARSVHPLAIALPVVGGAAADDRFELLLRQALEPRAAHLARSERDAPRHLPIDPQPILLRRGTGRHVARR